MPGDAGRPRDPDVDTRIVEAARVLLAEGGLDALTISAVATRAGVGRPTVYRRYAAPRDIALDVFYRDLEGLVGQVMAQRDPQAPILDQLMGFASVFLGYYDRQAALASAFLQLGLFAGGLWQQRFGAQAGAWLVDLAADFSEATRDGRLHPDVDTVVLVQTYFSLYLTVAVAGAQGMLSLDQQLTLLRRSLEQHLRGLVPG